MKVFKGFNSSFGDKCIICGSDEDKRTVLIMIEGTEDDGIAEAKQVHLDCIELRLTSMGIGNNHIIYQQFEYNGKGRNAYD